jgi:hypothetical protein
MNLKTSFYLLLACFGLIACDNGTDGSSSFFSDDMLAPANGGVLDIMVVSEDKIWNGTAGRAFEKHFIGMVYGLPQPEANYTVRQVNPSEFGSLLQRSRYIVLLGLNDSTGLSFESNRWAKGQFVVNITAPTEVELRRIILKSSKLIDQKIATLESKRLTKKLQPLSINEYPPFFEKHGLELDIPKDYSISVEKEDLVLYWKRTTVSDVGIMIYVTDLPKEDAIIGNSLIPMRDSLTKAYVPGSRDGSFMITEDLIKPQLNPVDFKDRFALEARGLWRTKGDIMGGPFVSYSIYDEDKNRLIYIDAFMLAPEKKKRKTFFEVESIIRGLRIL